MQVRKFLNNYTSLMVIVGAALLLELTTGVLFYAAQSNLQSTMERLVKMEMNAIYLCIRNKLIAVETTLDNMTWVVKRDLAEANWMFETPPLLVAHNPFITSAGICFTPDYYPQKGRWFEPVAIRQEDGSIEVKQVGSAAHDYTQKELYKKAVTTGKSHWSEPYSDKDGSKKEVTSYSAPVHNDDGKAVAVVFADISLGWLEDVMNEVKVYKSTQRFLTTGHYRRLAGPDTPQFRKALQQIKSSSELEGYFTMYDARGEKLHVFYLPVGGNTDWVLINILDDDEVFDGLRRTRAVLLLPVMIGLFFAGVIVWRSSRNLERLREATDEKNRIRGELRVASRIQQNMLPSEELSNASLLVSGKLEPAREVGGDLYDYFIRDEKLFFCIGDVTGKGAASAMLMAVGHSLFRSSSAHESNPARIMQAINEASCQDNRSNMFITMFVGVLDLPTGRLRYCDAGHDAPILLSEEGSQRLQTLPVDPHLPVGVFDDTKYTVQEMTLQPESTLFLYTDGLTEARNMEHRLFGLQRVEAVLSGCVNKKPQEILRAVNRAVSCFVTKAEQSDDLTMLAIRYTPKQFESVLTETLVIKNDVREVPRFSSFMKAAIEGLGIEPSTGRKLRLAVEEAVVNVIDYAYPAGSEGDISIKLMSDGKVLRVQIADMGIPFDPTEKERADTTLSAEDRQIGGLGILLVRELMDSINYEREDGKNILTLIKTL